MRERCTPGIRISCCAGGSRSRRAKSNVLLWVSKGKSNRDIGEILGLSLRTVNKHLEQISAKLGVENREAAAATAMELLSN
jgi:DNA-binding CsgD family transcriptional regulator